MSEDDNQRVPGLGGRLIETRRELARVQQQLDEVRSSTSWRITAPLRSLVGHIRGEPLRPRLREFGIRMDQRIPRELWRLASPDAYRGSDVSFVDCMPYLAGLFPDGVIQSFLEEGPAKTKKWNFTANESRSVGLISGACLARELAFETSVLRLSPEDAAAALQARPPEFLLIDTGLHETHSRWWSELRNADSAVMHAIRKECAAAKIPVVVWLRTDLADYPRFRHLLVGAVQVYAVGDDVYRLALEDVPRQIVSVMTSKVQPAIHNPIRTTPIVSLKSGLPVTVLRDAFGGDATDRLSPRAGLVGPISAQDRLVWDFQGVGKVSDETVGGQSPVIGEVRSEDRLVLSKLADAVSLTGDAGGPAWQKQQDMLRAFACALPVIADQMMARTDLASQFAELIANAAKLQSRQGQNSLSLAAWRRQAIDSVADGHRTADALTIIRSDLRLPQAPVRVVSCLMATKRPARLLEAVEMFRRQTYPHRELIIVMHGSDELPKVDVAGCRVVVLSAPASFGLGDCLNIAAERARGEYWAKMDDDDYYSEKYIARMVGLLDMSRADIAGMPLLFTHFLSDDSLYWDPARLDFAFRVRDGAWRSGEICGATLAGRRDMLGKVPFRSALRQGIDSAFLDDCARDGARIVVGDGFGYICRRSADRRDHTWEGDEKGIRSRGVRFDGDIESILAVVNG